MSDASIDAAPLFTPAPNSTANSVVSAGSPAEPRAPPLERAPSASPNVYVDIPKLSTPEREVYVADLPSGLMTDVDPDEVGKIIGEYRDGKRLYYYATHPDDIAHKFDARLFTAKYPQLVEEYRRNKKDGALDAFDPTGHYVHPYSRVRLSINLGSHASRKAAVRYVSSELTETDEPGGDDDDFLAEDTPVKKVRRSTRTGSDKELPFSPRKTRAKVTLVVPDSEDELAAAYESEPEARPARRSTRSKKGGKTSLKEDDAYIDLVEDDESDAFEDDEPTPRRAKPKKKARHRGVASRPAYGNIRNVADLAGDLLSDEETAPLRAHRSVCEKCQREPAHVILEKMHKRPKKKGRKKKKGSDDDLESSGDEEEKTNRLGGWVQCLKCPIGAHWRCLAQNQRDEILKAARERDRALWLDTALAAGEGSDPQVAKPRRPEPGKRPGLDAYQTTEFVCGSCIKGGVCMGCHEVALEPDTLAHDKKSIQATTSALPQSPVIDVDKMDVDDTQQADAQVKEGEPSRSELMYRCITCKRLCHYAHLPIPLEYEGQEDECDAVFLADYYQTSTDWQCADCVSFIYPLDKILAWRPYPADAKEPPRPVGQPPDLKQQLPREYLVKWEHRSYRRTQWVPHMWLLASYQAKLKNFLSGGSKVELLDEPVADEDAMDVDAANAADAPRGSEAPAFEIGVDESRASSAKPGTSTPAHPSDAVPDAERRIPPAWKTVDRVLDVRLWRSPKAAKKKSKTRAKPQKNRKRVDSDEDNGSDTEKDDMGPEIDRAFDEGEEPPVDILETIDEWQKRTKRELSMDDIDRVVWALFKWDDLGYDEASWDSPPRRGGPGYAAFENAFKRYIDARNVQVPIRPPRFPGTNNRGGFARYRFTNEKQPSIGQSEQLSLMPFQIDGLNWLCDNWWTRQPSILADDMGLGKTVQIASYIGTIVDKWDIFPILVVVPNSTISNWVRELERWAPRLRVVPFSGEARARDIIKQYELRHPVVHKGTTGAKYHVLVTTYDVITGRDFTSVFKSTPYWEALIVDEGQRLKNDVSLLFRKLNELKVSHRIILTGTPLNNNIRELFNLMNFLDPTKWNDLEALEKEYEVLTEDLVKQLHERLRPYFLRRIKSEVLKLPPKNEVIVPVSMAPLQKEIYRSIISQNLALLKSLTAGDVGKSKISKSNLNNMLMQLRKCLQHPYLVSEEIEPRGLAYKEAHDRLIGASTKLRFLRTLLPKLKERGHRVLLFSQFVIALDIIEDFLTGEGTKFLRLDGNTKQHERQKGMDEFNRPGSDVFIYLLSTRAGGVGINLFSADTVIIFDPDFNPHQDLQAIARAYRYGQQKTCLVFKLMVKDSAEERIMQTGKKKLVLDHLIVQKMDADDEGGEDVQSILTFGAKALFEEQSDSKDITYSDHDVQNLIEKTEKEGDQVEPAQEGGFSFAFAKVWSADKDTLEEMPEEGQEQAVEMDSWAQTLQRIEAERAKIQQEELTGRGARRRAAPVMPQQTFDFDDTPQKDKKDKKKKGRKTKTADSDDSDAYPGSVGVHSDVETESAGPSEDMGILAQDLNDLYPADKPVSPRKNGATQPSGAHRKALVAPLSPIQNHPEDSARCGLCNTIHGARACYMTESSENLAEYRLMLLVHAGDESPEERRAAIDAIEETLHKRGKLHLIHGQPLHLVLEGTYDTWALEREKKNAPANITLPKGGMEQFKGSAAGPSSPAPKRPASPSAQAAPAKKSKALCPVCNGSTHLLIECPAVKEGPKRIIKEIKRLDANPTLSSVVHSLRKILRKQKKLEAQAVAGTVAGPSSAAAPPPAPLTPTKGDSALR